MLIRSIGEMSIPGEDQETDEQRHTSTLTIKTFILVILRQSVFVSPDRIRSEDLCLHYRFMRELLCPPVLDTKDNY